MEKREKRKKKDSSFLTFISSDWHHFSKRRVFQATKSMSLPLPWTKAKHSWEASSIKDDNPSFPMFGSKVTLAFTREIAELKIGSVSVREVKTFSNYVKVTNQARKKGLLVWVLRFYTVSCPLSPSLSLPSSLLPPPASATHTHHPCPHNPLLPLPSPFLVPFQPHTPPPPSPPPTPAVYTLRPPRNVGPGCTFETVAPFINHRVWGHHNIHNAMNCKKKSTFSDAQRCATINSILTQILWPHFAKTPFSFFRVWCLVSGGPAREKDHSEKRPWSNDFERVKPRFRQKSVFKLVRGPRRWSLLSFVSCPQHFRCVRVSSSLFSGLFLGFSVCLRTVWISQSDGSSTEITFSCDVRKRRILGTGYVSYDFVTIPGGGARTESPQV